MEALLFVAVLMSAVDSASGGGGLRAGCVEGGGASVCEALGARTESGFGTTRFAEEPGLYFALACERGGRGACERAGAWAKKSYPEYESIETDVGCMLRDNGFACEEL